MTLRETVLNTVHSGKPLDVRTIAEKSGCSYYAAYKEIEKLSEEGFIGGNRLTRKGKRKLKAYDSDDLTVKELLKCAGLAIGYVAIGVCISFILTCLLG